MGRADFDVGPRISYGISYYLESSSRREHSKCGSADGLSRKSQPRSRAVKVLLGDSHVEKSLRIRLRKFRGHCGLGKVGVHYDKVLFALSQLYKSLSVSRSRCDFVCHYHSPPSSSTACFACSSFGALPCQPASSSMKETPFPLWVFAMIAVGFPLHSLA